jgi:release factor glutamine methyltransferase
MSSHRDISSRRDISSHREVEGPDSAVAEGREYAPMMSEADVERIRQWHDAAMADLRDVDGVRMFDYVGLTLAVPAQVMPIVPVSHLLGEAVVAEVRADDRVLDMGTGSGVNAILAARRARAVLAVDINPYALDAAQANAERNGVADRIEVRRSDIFTNVEGRFDLIIFDPPFRWFTPRDQLEMAAADENYAGLSAFFRGARARLTERGRILVFFGTSGDIAYLHRLIDEAGFDRETLASAGAERDGVRVSYFTYRLTTRD